MSTLRVNRITNEAGTGGPEFTKGVTFPSSQNWADDLTLNTTGIGTFTNMTATSINVSGTMTATSYEGNGTSVTNIPGVAVGKALALQTIIL